MRQVWFVLWDFFWVFCTSTSSTCSYGMGNAWSFRVVFFGGLWIWIQCNGLVDQIIWCDVFLMSRVSLQKPEPVMALLVFPPPKLLVRGRLRPLSIQEAGKSWRTTGKFLLLYDMRDVFFLLGSNGRYMHDRIFFEGYWSEKVVPVAVSNKKLNCWCLQLIVFCGCTVKLGEIMHLQESAMAKRVQIPIQLPLGTWQSQSLMTRSSEWLVCPKLSTVLYQSCCTGWPLLRVLCLGSALLAVVALLYLASSERSHSRTMLIFLA